MEGHRDSLGDPEWGAGVGGWVVKWRNKTHVQDACHVKVKKTSSGKSMCRSMILLKLLHVVSPVVHV